ncbi:MAG: hypothetical protein U9Q98_05845 [Bacteroidota bacterium]|nr:hypothetical protein [Bacteroidota bacterium]
MKTRNLILGLLLIIGVGIIISCDKSRPSDYFNDEVDFLIDKVYRNFDVIVDTVKGVGNEFAMVVGACYLAQATYGYWYDSANDSSSLWYGYLDKYTSKTGIFGRIWHAIKVAAVDTWAWIDSCHYDEEDGSYFWYVPYANFMASHASSTV